MKRKEKNLPWAPCRKAPVMTSQPPADQAAAVLCRRPGCGRPLPVSGRGRTRQFCSDDCARRYHNDARIPAPFTSTASISRRWKEITTNCRRPFRLCSMITSKRSITSAKRRCRPLPRPSLPRPPSRPSASLLNGFTPRATRSSRIARDVPAAHALLRTFRAAAPRQSPASAALAGKVPAR